MAALTLYTWPPCTSSGWQAAALPSVCVECLAVEAYLHLLGVGFTVKHCTAPEQSPTGALPACVFDDEQVPGCQTRHGEQLGPGARSGAVHHLVQAVADLDAPLRRDLQAQSVAFAALLDACLAPALVRLETRQCTAQQESALTCVRFHSQGPSRVGRRRRVRQAHTGAPLLACLIALLSQYVNTTRRLLTCSLALARASLMAPPAG